MARDFEKFRPPAPNAKSALPTALLLLAAASTVLAAPQPVLIAPNSSFLLPVPQASGSARVGIGETPSWLEAGLPGGDSFRAREVHRDLEFRMRKALDDSEDRLLTGRASMAAKQGEYDQMKRLAQEALSVVEKSQIEWHRKRVSGNLKKALPSESVRTIESSVAVVGGVAAVGLGAPLRLSVHPSLTFETKTHLLDRTGTWRLLSPAGNSMVEVRFFDEGSQVLASHSYPLTFIQPGLSAAVSATRMIDGEVIPGVTDDEKLQVNYSFRF
jgi:hypothetical protein